MVDVFMDRRAGTKIPVPKRQAWGVEDSTAPTRQLFDYGHELRIENRHTNSPEVFPAKFSAHDRLMGSLEEVVAARLGKIGHAMRDHVAGRRTPESRNVEGQVGLIEISAL